MRQTRLRLALAAVAVLAATQALAACGEPGWDLPALVAVLGRAAVDPGAPVARDAGTAVTIDFIGIHDCPGIRKVVAFDLSDAPFTLQLGDADVAAIAVALVPRR